jgi:hypothetical protein
MWALPTKVYVYVQVFEEEILIVCTVIVSVLLSKKVHIPMCLIINSFKYRMLQKELYKYLSLYEYIQGAMYSVLNCR